MKKIMISATLLIGMMASAMVFSSFTTSKENIEVLNVQGDWRRVGSYYGYDDNGKRSDRDFIIWEKDGMCGAYYWTCYMSGNPDEVSSRPGGAVYTGKLMKNSEGKWYTTYCSRKWYISL